MEAAAVRIHQRFQGQLISVIESADWANYRLSSDPLEVGRPAWPDPGKYCDLVLQRRSGHVEAALEVKTRHASIGANPTDLLGSVLDHMGTALLDLQRAAHEADAAWVVALGLYRVNFQSMAISYDAPLSDIVLVWGRDIGRDSPMASMRWASLASLDASMCGYLNPAEFFRCCALPRKAPPEISFKPPQPSQPPQSSQPPSPLDELMELSAWVNMRESARAALRVAAEWPNGAVMAIKPFARAYVTKEASEYAIQHQINSFVELGVIKGYRKGKRAHCLKIDFEALRSYLGGDDER